MKLYYSDTFALPLPQRHRFPMSKYTRLRQRVSRELVPPCELLVPPAATDEQLLRVHSPGYLDAVRFGRLPPLQQRRIGFPWSPALVERSRRSTGATIAAAHAALTSGISINLAGGTHHAFADSGQGYCVFNDTCVAARELQFLGLARNILVVDCDVHQGNGTSAIASRDPTLFSFSMHCSINYPFQKTMGDLDVALPAETGDEEYLDQLAAALETIEHRFAPDFVFYLAGADPYVGDRLGKLSLSKAGLRQRDAAVIDWCHHRRIPVALAMAGGYAPQVDDIVDIHFATVETAWQRYAAGRPAG